MCVYRERYLLAYLQAAGSVANSVNEFIREGSLFKGNLYNVMEETWLKF